MHSLPQAMGVVFRQLDLEDVGELQVLFERCSAFFELTEGAPVSPRGAEDELGLRAKGKGPEDTFCMGAFRGERLVGFIHLTRDYPKPNEWWLGLLLIDPEARGAGLGAAIDEALRSWAMANGARVMWLGVLVQNQAAERFWRGRGYVERERQAYVSAAGLQSTLVMMSLDLLR